MRRTAILFFVITAVAGTGFSANAAQPTDLPQRGKDPKGLVFDGLSRSDEASKCKGKYQLAHKDNQDGVVQELCTHGPDPAPDGVDVRERRGPEAGVAEATLLPGGGVAAATPGIQCYGTGSDGFRVHLIYARAADRVDRFATYASSFATWAASMDLMVNASAAETGGSRFVRFLTDSSCNLLIDRVTLSTTGDDNLSNTISELRSNGYNRTDRKYLVWADANVYCGIAQVYYDDRADATPGVNASNGHPQVPGEVARVDNGCWGLANSVEAHELMHSLGGVQTSAPNSTPNSHCRDEYDRMCYVDGAGVTMVYRCASAHENRFDCNHDDYFSTNAPAGSYLATHWNTANSAFLSKVPGGTVPPPTTTTTTTAPPTTTATTTATTAPPITTTTAPSTTTTTVPPPTTTTTVPPATARPSAPRSVTAVQPASGSVTLQWLAPTTGPVTGYNVYRGSGFGTPVLVATISNVSSFTNVSVPLGLGSYYVTAYNAAGEGPPSNRVWVFVR